MPNLKPNFEQISVQSVMDMIQDGTAEKEIPANQKSPFLPECGGAPADQHWREIARRIVEETDTTRMLGLVEQLVVEFDRARRETSPPPAAPPQAEANGL
jgi:hypothetical protein